MTDSATPVAINHTRLSRVQMTAWVVVSFVFGLLAAAPALLFRIDPAADYRGIEMQGTDAEAHYAARVKEMQDGFTSAANVFYSAPKQQPFLFAPMPEWTASLIARPFGLDAPRALTLSHMVFGTAACAVMIGFFYTFSRRFWWALLSVSVWMFAGFVFSGPSMLMRIVLGTQGAISFLSFARPISPEWSALLFFGALWGFVAWIRNGSRRALVLAAVATILSVYSYLYVWTLLGPLFVIAFVRYALRRDSRRLIELTVCASIIVLASLPYAANVWAAMHHPFYEETTRRHGMVASRHIVMGAYLVFLPLLVLAFRKRLGAMAWVAGAFAVAAIIAENQQIITGRSMVIAHYHWYFVKPFTAILFVMLIGSWVYDRWGRPWFHRRAQFARNLLIVAILLMMLFGVGALYQFRSYEVARPTWRGYQSTSGALSWLRLNTHAGDVVYASGVIRELIPVYTSADVYWAINAPLYLSSDVRARDAYFFQLWLAGVSADEAEATLFTTRRTELSSWVYSIYYREAGSYDQIPDEEVRRAVDAYRVYLARSIDERLLAYPLDYVVIAHTDPVSEGWKAIKDRSKQVYQDEAFEVRSIDKSP